MSMLEGCDAWYNEAPGDDPSVLFVGGELEFPTSGYTATLDYGDEGPTDDPTVTVLRLTVTPPSGGVDETVSYEPVTWEDSVPGQKTVRIDTPEGSVSIDVKHLG